MTTIQETADHIHQEMGEEGDEDPTQTPVCFSDAFNALEIIKCFVRNVSDEIMTQLSRLKDIVYAVAAEKKKVTNRMGLGGEEINYFCVVLSVFV